MVEQLTVNQFVPGSSPGRGARSGNGCRQLKNCQTWLQVFCRQKLDYMNISNENNERSGENSRNLIHQFNRYKKALLEAMKDEWNKECINIESVVESEEEYKKLIKPLTNKYSAIKDNNISEICRIIKSVYENWDRQEIFRLKHDDISAYDTETSLEYYVLSEELQIAQELADEYCEDEDHNRVIALKKELSELTGYNRSPRENTEARRYHERDEDKKESEEKNYFDNLTFTEEKYWKSLSNRISEIDAGIMADAALEDYCTLPFSEEDLFVASDWIKANNILIALAKNSSVEDLIHLSNLRAEWLRFALVNNDWLWVFEKKEDYKKAMREEVDCEKLLYKK